MRHRKLRHNLSRPTGPRKALMRNLAHALIMHERIETTRPKAKALKPFIEKLITQAKEGSQHSRRVAFSTLARKDAVHRLFTDVAPLFDDRNGGYTRILPLGPRKGDGAEMVLIEFVKRTEAYHEKQETKAARRERKQEAAQKRPSPQM